MLYWKWSTGEEHYRSPRPDKTQAQNQDVSTNTQKQYTYETSHNAIQQSLDESRFSSYDNDLMSIQNDNSSSMREELDDKISSRDPVYQRGSNPFLGQSSYVNDIVTRDMFLKPVNTTNGERKNNKSEENYSSYN